MPDDPIVKIRHVHRPIWTKLQIDRPAPRVVAHQKIGLAIAPKERAARLQTVVIDPMRDRIADEHRVAKLGRKLRGGVIDNARDRRRAVHVIEHCGPKT